MLPQISRENGRFGIRIEVPSKNSQSWLNFVLDPAKAKAMLGWAAKTGLEEMITMMVDGGYEAGSSGSMSRLWVPMPGFERKVF